MSLLAEQLIETLRVQGLTLATAESCTGGWVAKVLTDVPGSSTCFKAGIVAYSNEVKERVLGVPADLILDHGAVSPQVAEAMATGGRRVARADIAVALTGVAGPSGGTPQKPVGLVYLAVAHADSVGIVELRLSADLGRAGIREAAVEQAIAAVAAVLPT